MDDTMMPVDGVVDEVVATETEEVTEAAAPEVENEQVSTEETA